LGIGKEIMTQPVPLKIAELDGKRITKVFAAADVSACMNNKGEVYVWGKSGDGAIGLFPGDADNVEIPSLLPYMTRIEGQIKDISFSSEHGALVDVNGNLYTWGKDLYGKLGHEELKAEKGRRTIPKNSYERIKFNKVGVNLEGKRIKQVSCGYNHTVCLTEDGEVYTWGYGKDGQLGHNDFDSQKYPKKLEFFAKNHIKVKQIKSGQYYIVVLTEDGKMYSWGKNNFGQLGLGQITHEFKINTPLQINIGAKVKEIYCGEDNSGCIAENGDTYLWGYGLDGRLANTNKINISIPQKLEGVNGISKLALGGHHTAVITHSGELYMCGNGRNGELGRGELLESHSVMRDQMLIVRFSCFNKFR
jgi:alpha-tubulin suppressor-like RCC1 family protein